ncbi:MAG: hypothetical protein J6A85_08245 [Clostridia bacterium]|nr:hypothetical protein [Clostridia bacterium]
MDVNALDQYISKEIRKEVYVDHIKLFLPFYFGSGSTEPLCLVWDENEKLSDCGRTLSELEKRVGDLAPYMQNISNILNAYGSVTLESGRRFVVRDYQTCVSGEDEYKDYMGGLNMLLRVLTLVSISDVITVDEHGTVSICQNR